MRNKTDIEIPFPIKTMETLLFIFVFLFKVIVEGIQRLSNDIIFFFF